MRPVNPFSFDGEIDRRNFIFGALVALALEQIFHAVLLGDYWFSLAHFAYPLIAPLRDGWEQLFEGSDGRLDGIAFGVPIGLILLCLWRLTALCFRRARTTGTSPLWAAFAMVPFLQVAACALLAYKPQRPCSDPDALQTQREARWHAILLGIFTGVSIAVMGTLFFSVILGEYGIGLFIGVPIVLGFTVGYCANRAGDIGASTTLSVIAAIFLTSIALAGFAIEGLVCIVMVLPFAIVFGLLGGAIGRAWVRRNAYRNRTMATLWFVPILFGVEALAPAHQTFESSESIVISAGPQQVWDSVVHMNPIPDQPAAPFGWGLAYPQRGIIRGSGVGAVREGVFSTGVAYERVTVWEPGKRLYFDVLSDPPMMQELTPYGAVAAKHTVGYFKTRDARFTIVPLVNGRTRLILETKHELDIGPLAYFRPITDWAIHANKRRVLTHFKNQAERSGITD